MKNEVTIKKSLITRSASDSDYYGISLHWEWYSDSYRYGDYMFILWKYTENDHSVIHLRTWQPDMIGDKPFPLDEVYDLVDFDL